MANILADRTSTFDGRADMNSFSRQQRARISHWGLRRTLAYYVFGVAADKLGVKLLSAYEYRGHPAPPAAEQDVTFSMLDSMDGWTARDRDGLAAAYDASTLLLFSNYFARGDKCVAARWEGVDLASQCWIEFTRGYSLAPGQSCAVLHSAYTWPAHRGKGLYPQSLRFACSSLQGPHFGALRVFADCSIVNYASKKGIEKAGFAPAGLIVNAFNRSWPRANRIPSSIGHHDAAGVP
jgi:hypothetical protein